MSLRSLSPSEHAILYGPDRPDFLQQECLADLLEATAARSPDKTALIDGAHSLSYAQLNEKAGVIAAGLLAAGAGPGKIVGLWMPRGIDLLVAQAAIAKTGAAWLPMDADVPAERVQVCLDDANACGLLSSATFTAQTAPIQHTVWTVEALAQTTELRTRPAVQGSDPAYVIYTSGSTGKPKGILVSQASICHFLRSENAVLGIRSDDKVYQGFSVAFDMSFEEIWISYLVGATLWIAPREITADPDALPAALDAENITVLHAVPTLLALFTRDIPGLRLINLGGEMCPESLVSRWSCAGRQMFNTYGPTEASVSASLAALEAGKPVTIGSALPNYVLMVVAIEGELRLLKPGETGELCISGPGVAVGYLGRPDLTEQKFLPNPWARSAQEARLYRTGDLAVIQEDGSVQCLGRADDQVKIRGFRVELGEIESLLAAEAGVGTVAVVLRKDGGIDQIVAFLARDINADASVLLLNNAELAAQLRLHLAQRLPPYMVPSRFEWMEEVPRLTSGKIDRNTLKALPLAAQAASGESDIAENDAESALFPALATLFPGQPIVRSADFFRDLGGHSLLAAKLVSAVRQDVRFAGLKIADIYQHRQVGAIAAALATQQRSTVNATVKPRRIAPVWQRLACGAAQAMATPVLVAIRMIQWLAPFFAYHYFTGDPGDSIARAMALSVLVFLGLTVAEFFVAIIGKWLIAGNLRPGRYPLWGLTYFRWWLADRLVEAAPAYMLSGSSLYRWWLRALGAKIGRDVIIGSMTIRAPGLLRIGDGASVGNACNFENARVENGELVLGEIVLADDAYVGSYSVLEGNTRLESAAHLDGQSALADGQTVPAGRVWKGSPARDSGAFDRSVYPPRPSVSNLRHTLEALYFAAGALLVAALFFMPVFPVFVMIDWFDSLDILTPLNGNVVLLQLLKYFLLAFPATGVLIVGTALLSAFIRWAFLPRLHSGLYPVHSVTYCAKWLVNQIQESSLHVLHGVYATVYAPFWYRLLGAKVGKGAEISTALGVVPDMLTLGEDTFIADAVLLGDEQIDCGWMEVKPTVVSRRSFVGNGAYIPDGTILPEEVLIGVHTAAPDNDKMRPGDTWLGSPAMHLPAREEVKGFPESLTFAPSVFRRIGRGLVEAFRIISPHALVTAVGYTVVLDLMPMAGDERWTEVIVYLVLAGLAYGFGCFVFVLVLKWLLIGRYRQSAVPMWTPFVWLSEAITNLYEGIAVPNFMRYLRGTPWLPMAFNLLGARIGKGVYMDTTDITEFDCVHIGDHSEINALCCPQTHLFEDRIMKIDQVEIGSGVYMGPRSCVLYSAQVGDNVTLGPLTLVMKGEFIPAQTRWHGCPAEVQ